MSRLDELLEQRRLAGETLSEVVLEMIEEAKKQERESMSNVFGYIEDMFPELSSSYWNTKRWLDFKNEQLGQALKGD